LNPPTDKGELARRQANEDTLRRFHDETAKQRQRLENLRAANDQLKREIKDLQSP
jgi:cell division protein FtsB